MFVCTTVLYEYMNLLRNDVYRLFVNTHLRIKIYREFYHFIIYIANEERHIRMKLNSFMTNICSSIIIRKIYLFYLPFNVLQSLTKNISFYYHFAVLHTFHENKLIYLSFSILHFFFTQKDFSNTFSRKQTFYLCINFLQPLHRNILF